VVAGPDRALRAGKGPESLMHACGTPTAMRRGSPPR